MSTDPSDPFEPLDRIDPPDQWDDITSRAAELGDVILGEEAVRDGRSTRTRALLAVAAALVLVVGGLALARSGDDAREVATADTTTPPPSTIPGACPFSLEPGPDVPSLRPSEVPATPEAALTPLTAGEGEVGENVVRVLVTTFPSSEAQSRSRWSGWGPAESIGWFDGGTPAGLLTSEPPAGPSRLTAAGGGHLGEADVACRDVLVLVSIPATSSALEPGPSSPTTAPEATAGPTTPSGERSEGVDRSTTTTHRDGTGPVFLCLHPEQQSCHDTRGGPEAGPGQSDNDLAAGRRVSALIETVLDAVRFPEPESAGNESAASTAAASPSPSTTPPPGAPTTAGPTTAPPAGQEASGSRVTGTLTRPGETTFKVWANGDQGVCAEVGREPVVCTGFAAGRAPIDTSGDVGSAPGFLALSSTDPDRSTLHYGLLPCCYETVVLITEDGGRVEAGISTDRRVWAVADPSPLPRDEAPPVTILAVQGDGTQVEIPPA